LNIGCKTAKARRQVSPKSIHIKKQILLTHSMDLQKIEAIKKQIAEAKETYLKLAKDAFHEGAAELFAENPVLNKVEFTGYAPFFNDGDECTFSVHSDYPTVNDEIDYVTSQDAFYPTYQKVVQFIQTFDDEFYEQTFGRHFKMTITKEGVDVEEYTDHD
jgi:hypothetical protein